MLTGLRPAPTPPMMTKNDKAALSSSIVINHRLRAITGTQVGSRVGARHPMGGVTSNNLEIPMKTRSLILALGATLLAAAVTAGTADAASRRVVRPNAAGGTTATAITAHEGPNGGKYVRGRGLATDGQGDARYVSGGAFKGPDGATGGRAGTTSRSADGSMTHQSGMTAQGARGSVQSSGSATRDASGNVSQSRTSTATSAATGDTIKTSESYTSGSGVTRSASCFDAGGNSIACPGH